VRKLRKRQASHRGILRVQFNLRGLLMRTEGMMRHVVVGGDAEAVAVVVVASLGELRVSWSKARAKARAEAEAVLRIRAEARIQDRHLQPQAEAVRPDR
jgi:hypothetical protein